MSTIDDVLNIVRDTLVPELRAIDARLTNIEENLRVLRAEMNQRLIAIEGDLRTFYRDLGRHDSRLDNLEGRQ
jgi:tetrahydromethanopterin S-methyltransferase subunit G